MKGSKTTRLKMRAEKQLKAEREQEHCVKEFMQQYLNNPSALNMEAVINTLKIYQVYWMDGRTR